MVRGPGATHDERRSELVDAVLAVAAERGVTGVTQARVAAAAGVSAGRVQHYFPTMTELLGVAFDRLNTASAERIRELVGGDLDAAPPRRVLETVLTELIPHDATTRAHLQFRQSFTALALVHDDVAARLREQYHRLHHEDLAALVRRIRDDVDPVRAATGLAALAEGLAYYVLIGAVDAAAARAQVLDAVADLAGPSAVGPTADRPAG